MFNYIQNELTRLLKKKSSYLFYAFFLVGATIILFLNEADTNATSMAFVGMVLVSISAMIFSTKIFYSVYGDDLTHKTLSLVFSTGLSKLKFVISKLIVYIIALLGVYLVFGIYYYIVWMILVGQPPVIGSTPVNMLLTMTLGTILVSIGFASIASIVSYFFQNANGGGILIPLMTMGLTSQIVSLLTMAFNWLQEPSKYLLSNQMNLMNQELQNGMPIRNTLYIVVGVYIILGIVLSTLALESKDTQIN